MNYCLKYKPFNEYSILIEWPSVIDENILYDILSFKTYIENHYQGNNVEITSTYTTTLVYFFDLDKDIKDEIFILKSSYEKHILQLPKDQKQWEIPVCYDDEFGIDLEAFSIKKKMSKDAIITQHSSQLYTVYFIGFLPGFLYLGGLHEALHCKRKSTPNLNIKKGAVGIGGKQTGIYPQNSPGGWHIIGNSPINFFNTNHETPCFANAGDKITFKPITKNEYDTILYQVETKSYNLKFKVLQ